ncbi:MAG: C25 family cysteine peptidase [Ignavibacteria bacterium]
MISLLRSMKAMKLPGGSSVSDFATGRMPVNTLEEANNYIEKVISYENPANFDKWRQRWLLT